MEDDVMERGTKNSGVSSLFCNDEGEEQPVNEYVLEKNGYEGENNTGDIEYPDDDSTDSEISNNTDNEKRSKSITVKIYGEDVDQFEKLKAAMWAEADSIVLKNLINIVYKSKKRKIEGIIEERNRIEELKNSIGSL
jgi:hypothetical protein